MIFVMPYESNPYLYLGESLLGIIPDFTVIKLLGLVGFGWALMRIGAGALPEGILASRQARLFALFVLGVVLAGLLSGTGFVAVSRYLGFLLFLPLVLVSVRTHDDLRRVLTAIALSLILTFPYAIRQMIRFDARLGVGLYEPNYFAANLVLVIPLALAIASLQPRPGRRALWTGGALLLVAALFLTSSRGGFLGLLVAAFVFVYRRRGAGAAIGLIAVLVLAVLPTPLGERAVATLFEHAEAPTGLQASNEAHLALFWGALRMIADAPLTGVGPYNFKALSAEYSGLAQNAIAHNTYLELAAELGLPVLAIFVLLVAAVFRGLRRAVDVRGLGGQAVELAAWAEGLRSGLVGFLVAATFISAQYEKWLWLVVFVSIAVERLAILHERRAAAGEEPSAAPLPPLSPHPSAAPAAPGVGA